MKKYRVKYLVTKVESIEVQATSMETAMRKIERVGKLFIKSRSIVNLNVQSGEEVK